MCLALRIIFGRLTLILSVTLLLSLEGQADLQLQEIREDFFSRRFPEAEAKLRLRLEKQPTDDRAAYLLVRTLIEANRPQDALAAAESALEACPSCAMAHLAVGDAKYRQGEFESARARYQEAVRLNGREARALLGLGLILSSEFRFREAQQHLRQAFELSPDDPDIADALASTLAHGPEQLALQEQYANSATYRDPLELAGVKARLQLLRLREARVPFFLKEAPDEMVLPLVSVRNHPRMPPIAFLLPVSINGGEPRNLLVDSGSHGLLISSRYARQDAIAPLVSYDLRGLGDQGRLATKLGWAETIQIGDAVWQDCPVIITEKNPAPRWVGIIGTDVLRDFLITMDMAKEELRLMKLPPGDSHAVRRKDYEPVRQVGGKLLLRVHVNSRRDAHFVLDTGSFRSLAARNMADGVMDLAASRRGVKGLSGQVKDVLQSRNVTLEVGGMRYRENTMLVLDFAGLSHSLGVEIGGLLGVSLLRDSRLTIDYRNGLVHLAPGN